MLSQHLFSGLTWDKIPAQNAKIMIWSKLAHIAVQENKDVWLPMPNSLTRKAEFWQLFHWNSLWWICLSEVFVFSEEGTEFPGWSKYEMSSMSLLRACWLDKPMSRKKIVPYLLWFTTEAYLTRICSQNTKKYTYVVVIFIQRPLLYRQTTFTAFHCHNLLVYIV